MAGEIIRQGDPTNHGGTVLEGSLADICHGKPISYIGHKVSCPQCKGTYPIVEGVQTTTFYGKGVAIAGMKTACGATLIATQFTDIIEVGSGGKPAESSAEPAVFAMASAALLSSGADARPAGASTDNLAPARPIVLRPQNNDGVWVSPPTQKEVDVAIKYQKPFKLEEHMYSTRAMLMRKMNVKREGTHVTLSGAFLLFSAVGEKSAKQIVSDIQSRFQGLSYVSEGLTYRTDFRFTISPVRDGADIRIDFFELKDDRGQAQKNGQILLDLSADAKVLRSGVGAHEFAHAVLGVPDGYHDITLTRPEGSYYLRGVPYKEQTESLMSDLSKPIPGPDLKKIILKIEEFLK